MFRGPSFIVSTMQEETTPIFKRLWYDWTQQQPGIEPTNPLGQCWVPPIVAFYDQQGLLRTYSLPEGFCNDCMIGIMLHAHTWSNMSNFIWCNPQKFKSMESVNPCILV